MVYLIDASVYVFRAWHALPPQLRDADGNPTHALYGFAGMLCELLQRRRPDYVGAAFDASPGGGFRTRLYPPYKANREPAPAQLRRQFALCREFCRHLGVADFASEEYEADDLIGSLVARVRAEGLRVTIVTRDKDLAQLIGPGDVYWDYAGCVEYRHGDIAGRFGVAPERMADFLALTGDAVDNVPGVPGVGRKTAAALLGRFASLEELYAGLERVATLPLRGAATLAARLDVHRDAAFRARELTRICCAVPLHGGRELVRRRAPDVEAVAAFCRHHGFGSALPQQARRIAHALLHGSEPPAAA
ncbi:MAG: exodeoxyribonuclease IX [Gammaproteobacteria bacterium]|nr:exodeoxyribonuclease IX [Gammaproteobacteria bacterium]